MEYLGLFRGLNGVIREGRGVYNRKKYVWTSFMHGPCMMLRPLNNEISVFVFTVPAPLKGAAYIKKLFFESMYYGAFDQNLSTCKW